jgi:AcrR family transcriptional regulator
MNKVYKGEQTREKILTAAVELFGDKGFDQVSLKMIGDEVGISQAAVAQHFGTKRNIIFRVRELVTKSNQGYVDAAIRPFDTPTKQLIDYAIANLEWGFKNRKLAQIIVLTYYFAMIDQEFQEAQKKSVQIATERVEKYVISCFREDKFLKRAQTFQVATVIHQYVFGAFVRELAAHAQRREAKDLVKNFEETIPVLLRAQS